MQRLCMAGVLAGACQAPERGDPPPTDPAVDHTTDIEPEATPDETEPEDPTQTGSPESSADETGSQEETSGAGAASESSSGGEDAWDPNDWPYCAPTLGWDPTSASVEEQVLELVNQQRAVGGNCGPAGSFPPSEPLVMHEALRCAARNHSLDMATRGFFGHTNPDGEDVADRATAAGYSWSWVGENIAQGPVTPAAVMNGWMASPGHCANILAPMFTEIGVGHQPSGFAPLWTQVFGAQ